jgi:hypothetical protein
MKMEEIDQAIVDALKRTRDEALLAAVVRLDQRAYDRIVSRIYPCPRASHPQEVDDKLCEFIECIAKVDPSIITNNVNHKDPFARARVIKVAGGTRNTDFADIIIERCRTGRSPFSTTQSGRLRPESIYGLLERRSF